MGVCFNNPINHWIISSTWTCICCYCFYLSFYKKQNFSSQRTEKKKRKHLDKKIKLDILEEKVVDLKSKIKDVQDLHKRVVNLLDED